MARGFDDYEELLAVPAVDENERRRLLEAMLDDFELTNGPVDETLVSKYTDLPGSCRVHDEYRPPLDPDLRRSGRSTFDASDPPTSLAIVPIQAHTAPPPWCA